MCVTVPNQGEIIKSLAHRVWFPGYHKARKRARVMNTNLSLERCPSCHKIIKSSSDLKVCFLFTSLDYFLIRGYNAYIWGNVLGLEKER